MNKKKVSVWEYLLSTEIGIEFKACLYFFCILFYYSVYRLTEGEIEANIVHMAEMIVCTYGMGYVQRFLLSNFDEGDRLKGREIIYVVLCSLIYTGAAFGGSWFDRNIGVGIGFFAYMVLVYVCAFLIYKLKRMIDAKLLNEDLKAFQERDKNEKCDRDS